MAHRLDNDPWNTSNPIRLRIKKKKKMNPRMVRSSGADIDSESMMVYGVNSRRRS